LFGAHTSAVDFTPVDHAAIARACGLQGLRVTEPEGYADALALAIKSQGTTVIDAFVDPDAHPPITLFENKTISRWSDSHESMA
jgi:acetolactate synthase-1/2/3 large subunit